MRTTVFCAVVFGLSELDAIKSCRVTTGSLIGRHRTSPLRVRGSAENCDISVAPTPSEIGAMANRVGAKALILTHFRKYMDKQSNYNAAERLASDAFGRKIKIAEDLLEIKI